MARNFAVVINECTQVLHSNTRAINFRQTTNAGPNFNFQPETLASGLPRELNDREMDWLELMVALYATDIACQRGEGDLDWGRDIQLHMPLRDPTGMEPYRVALQEIFGDLTGDRLRIGFHQEQQPEKAPRYGKPWAQFDCVALFSGGVDSYVGAAQLLDEGRLPLYLSHGAGANTTPQKAARKALEKRFSKRPDARVSTNQLDNFGESEDSQRARSILFMGAAAVIAAVAGVREIYINENGIMAVHIPMTTARWGSLSTKTAYPPIVEKIATVASQALRAQIEIRNKLITATKPEVVALAKQLSVDGALAQTASCWTWQRGRKHCGVCIPCLTRRISFETEGVPDATHAADPFDKHDDVKKPFARDNMVHLCQVVSQMETLSDNDFELEFPEILDGGQMIRPAEVRDLYRRWSAQALNVLRAHSVPPRFLT